MSGTPSIRRARRTRATGRRGARWRSRGSARSRAIPPGASDGARSPGGCLRGASPPTPSRGTRSTCARTCAAMAATHTTKLALWKPSTAPPCGPSTTSATPAREQRGRRRGRRPGPAGEAPGAADRPTRYSPCSPCSSAQTDTRWLRASQPTSGSSIMPMKTCADTSGRIASNVAPSAASRTSRTAAAAPGQPPVALAAARAHDGRCDSMRPRFSLVARTSSTGAWSGHG